MANRELRHGYTTGACAAAAVKGAAQMLRDQELVHQVELNLPTGETALFPLHGQQLQAGGASCFVVKDAGDDPDVTNGAEVHARVDIEFLAPRRIIIQGGEGIGRVTKPGLAVPVGEWAINPVPRRMIHLALREVFAMRCIPATLTVSLSIPDGAERAKKTLNERLGIVGGLSILGTTGIVRPISAQAWTDTIDTAIDVALACGSGTVVLSTGRSSELAVQHHFTAEGEQLPEEAYVMMGDHVGHAVRSCLRKGVRQLVLAGQFAKLLKIACGHEQTHVSSSDLDLRTLADWVTQEPGIGQLRSLVTSANTARQVLEESGYDPRLVALVCHRALKAVRHFAPGLAVKVFMAGYRDEVLYFA
ncbi:cobalt-precorrin-5B (C(1))-methyltransferase [Geobacter sp. DSM 9736]|uniref:cobalt-precorrin-5B (C(1))-methyltransferase n=1 Tax=Geobacter sp. DSM 9736 TaxID=1277350 RepID=UPI000B511726|nr:cobalt-precorrin-5B (C(1))-methyltransferase [Geobacter sp. DSM 9736]SNB46978.1 cobalt-precorrin-5B (C1)-methyltransferase [Geobacter sp. DSM 9736]